MKLECRLVDANLNYLDGGTPILYSLGQEGFEPGRTWYSGVFIARDPMRSNLGYPVPIVLLNTHKSVWTEDGLDHTNFAGDVYILPSDWHSRELTAEDIVDLNSGWKSAERKEVDIAEITRDLPLIYEKYVAPDSELVKSCINDPIRGAV